MNSRKICIKNPKYTNIYNNIKLLPNESPFKWKRMKLLLKPTTSIKPHCSHFIVNCHLHTKKIHTSQVIHKQFIILNNFAYNQLFSSTMSWSLAAFTHSLTVFNIGVIFFQVMLFLIKMHSKSHLYNFLDQLLHSP